MATCTSGEPVSVLWTRNFVIVCAFESVASAQRRLLDQVGVLAPETVSLEAALGRILAEPISSRSDLPRCAIS